MSEHLIRCSCSMPHLCTEREPNRTHGLVDYRAVTTDREQQERLDRLDEMYKDGVPNYQTRAAFDSTELFKQCLRPHYSGNW
jgi:hypothetical protein